ncbi:FAST kinase domain-containing protein 4 [Lycorma delicatula]|uniref:FAST kinase domain-containing protein 4 n=1 Tax=Lycorma delicatula TaxID=130591 RepID=UPI003F511152
MLMRYKSLWRGIRAFQHSGYSNSSAIGVNPATSASSTAADSSTEDIIPKATEIPIKDTLDRNGTKPPRGRTKLVSAAFNSLKDRSSSKTDELDSLIKSADTVESLLSVSEKENFGRQHAFKIVSKLADWTTEDKVKLVEFENDNRFSAICEILGHHVSTKPFKKLPKGDIKSEFSDLGVVLGVAGDDEAAKLVNTITVPQMIKVMLSLAYKKRRSIPLLRSLAFNIGKSSDEINIKDCADVLYACAQLSFQDEILFEKISSELCQCIKNNNKPAVVGSVVTSLGIIRYKDKELLDLISQWVMENFSVCRIQDFVSLILTLASVNHIPFNGDTLFQKLETHLQQSDITVPSVWLDVVWSLVVLKKATNNHISSVLNKEFIHRLASSQLDDISTISKVKLLNINAAAKLISTDYTGPFLDSSTDFVDTEVPRAKEKQTLVACVSETLSNLLPSSVYMKTNINTGMGYIIDGECVVDSNLTPLPLIDKKNGNPIDRSQPGVRKGHKIAILVLDYHDFTKGHRDPAGLASLMIELTKKSGYKVITVPYYDFNSKDKLVTRVQYLEQQLKSVVKNATSS